MSDENENQSFPKFIEATLRKMIVDHESLIRSCLQWQSAIGYDDLLARAPGLAGDLVGFQMQTAGHSKVSERLTLTPGGDACRLAMVTSAKIVIGDPGEVYVTLEGASGNLLAEWQCESRDQADDDVLRVAIGKEMAIRGSGPPVDLRDVDVSDEESDDAPAGFTAN